MLSIEQIREKLTDRNLAEVSRRIGITRAYLGMIANGSRIPSYATLKKLSDYLQE